MLTLGLTLVMVWRGVFTTRLIVSPEWPEGHGSGLIFGPRREFPVHPCRRERLAGRDKDWFLVEEPCKRFGVHGLNFGEVASDFPTMLRLAMRADELGFDSVWLGDHIIMQTRIASSRSVAPPVNKEPEQNSIR
jgi:hypothetical protein